MSRWFRFYDDALTDRKVQGLPPHLFKHWVNCLCVASKNDGDLGTIDDLAKNLCTSGMWLARGRAVVTRLLERGLLERCGDHITPHNWHHRQYKSDQSTQRVKAWRKRFSNVSGTLQIVPSGDKRNVSETAQNRTDIKKKEGLQEESKSANQRLISPSLEEVVRAKGWA